MKILMDEVDKKKFDQMCEPVARLDLELCGGRFTDGFVKDMKSDFADHTKGDADNFDKVLKRLDSIEKYKEKSKLLVGWSWKAIGVIGGFIVFICGLFQFLIEVIFK